MKSKPIHPCGHAFMYMTRHHKNTPIQQTRHCPNKHSTSYHNDLNDLEDLIALNECSYEVDNQLTSDRQHEVSKLNIIIRKDKTKPDLADFLHAALLIPVKSILLKAIKNNHFTNWSGMNIKFMRK